MLNNSNWKTFLRKLIEISGTHTEISTKLIYIQKITVQCGSALDMPKKIYITETCGIKYFFAEHVGC
jgi:hypothetical protein